MLIRAAHLFSRYGKWAILAFCALVSISAAVWQWTAPLDYRIDEVRASLFRKPVSGQTVIVEIDTESVGEVHSWPWPRSIHGHLVDRLNQAGARRIVFDVVFATPSSVPREDEAFAAALRRAGGRVVLPGILENADGQLGERLSMLPHAPLLAHAEVGAIWILLDPDLQARQIPYSVELEGRRRPSIGTYLADRPTTQSGDLPLDWSYDIATLPRVSYADVLAGRFPRDFFSGRNVLVAPTAMGLGDRFTVPSYGRMPGAYIQAVASETLRHRSPILAGPWPAIAAVALLVLIALTCRSLILRNVTLIGTVAAAILLPPLLREFTPFVLSPGPAIVTAALATALALAAELNGALIARVTQAPMSKLPNLTAMCISAPDSAITVAVRLRNHLEITALLGPDLQGELLRKVYDRLTLAASDAAVFQVDDHSFAWRTTGTLGATTDAIEGLHALFASGIAVGDRTVDVTISVGISDEAGMDVESAVTAAMAAASRAERRGLNWERYEADDDDDANWRLSLLNELDRAIDHGDVWVAYQPKYDLVSGTMCGAEALVRWSHALRGEIRPDQFIPTLEENGRIEKLTLHVLDTALRDFATLDRSLSIAINISARMIGRNRLLDPISEMLARHRVDADRLTLEITESAALAGSAGIDELNNLRALGVHISIDDYGTGQSTLSYLKTLPATELKIDRSFVGLIASSRSDAAVVDSTVKLAHALGLTVVAEGVETEEVLALLKQMNCDMIQGYLVGEPARFEQFVKRLATRRTIRVA